MTILVVPLLDRNFIIPFFSIRYYYVLRVKNYIKKTVRGSKQIGQV